MITVITMNRDLKIILATNDKEEPAGNLSTQGKTTPLLTNYASRCSH